MRFESGESQRNKFSFETAFLRFDASSADEVYSVCRGETLYSYYEQEPEAMYALCESLEKSGFILYSKSSLNGNLFATYHRGEELCHVYWIKCERELNVAFSEKSGAALPFCLIEKTEGIIPSVTQLKSDQPNGMGYVVRLSDGSFIIYDGGYRHHAEALWNALTELNSSENGIVIRAWVITHAHADHYPCFSEFSKRYADKVTLETVMIAPAGESDTNDKYLHEGVIEDIVGFKAAKLLYVHTGMSFEYGDVVLEVLFSADELLISDSPLMHGMPNRAVDLNDTSLVTRVYTKAKSCLFLGDAYSKEAYRMIAYYGEYLKSDMCQISHHGLEEFPLIAYRHIRAEVLFYPCSQVTYTREGRSGPRFENVRRALRASKYTKEIITHQFSNETRYLV